MTNEQMCRELLGVAIRDGLVCLIQSPHSMTSGDLAGMANLLSVFIHSNKGVQEMIGGIKIGDGTAPKGFPSYGKSGERLQCNFNQCGHRGSLTSPSKMDCSGKHCPCPCCRFLSGETVHGCTYGSGI